MTTVDHDYPVADAMLIVDETNTPVEAAQIRIFDHVAFQAGETDTWEAETTSDADGKWVDPVILEDGRTWVVHVQKPSVAGPEHVEITT
jgi:hypothetical protein